jgi:hypothetical protein
VILDRPAQEIEITSAMVAAARRAFVSFDPRVTDSADGAIRIVKAALAAGGYSFSVYT